MASVNCLCVGHRIPLFQPSVEYQMVCPNSLGTPREIVIDDGRFGHGFDGGSLAEYSQLFGLCDMVAAGDFKSEYLFLFQYRKFLSPIPWEQVSEEAPWLKHAPLTSVGVLFPTMETLDASASNLTCGPLINLGSSIAENYSRWHHSEDFALFCAACGESGVLSNAETASMVTFGGLIPSPALTMTRLDVFYEIFSRLQRVWSTYARSYLIRREGYQRRVSGYLLERLHSELVLGMVRNGKIPELKIWERFLVPGRDSIQVAI